MTLFALLGGVYGFQIATSGPVSAIIKALPSYWLVQAGKTALGAADWPAEGWIVIAAWTAVLVLIAVCVYRREPGARPRRKTMQDIDLTVTVDPPMPDAQDRILDRVDRRLRSVSA